MSRLKKIIPRTKKENREKHAYMLEKFDAIPHEIFWQHHENEFYQNKLDNAEFVRDLQVHGLDDRFYYITNQYCEKHTPQKHSPQLWVAPMDKNSAIELLSILQDRSQ